MIIILTRCVIGFMASSRSSSPSSISRTLDDFFLTRPVLEISISENIMNAVIINVHIKSTMYEIYPQEFNVFGLLCQGVQMP